mmetsp:Transcript_31458/g.60672  ORF Transcript_31458/g.60672 Transcript_31458/m.60672 type:complete len:139 (-) Transcript_31458:263-679(-)
MGSNYLVTSIVLTCMLIFSVDRNFLLAALWSLIGAVCSLFGFMHTIKLGVWVKTHDYGWRFCVGYSSIAALMLCLHVAQSYGLVEPTIEDDKKDGLEMDNNVAISDESRGSRQQSDAKQGRQHLKDDGFPSPNDDPFP